MSVNQYDFDDSGLPNCRLCHRQITFLWIATAPNAAFTHRQHWTGIAYPRTLPMLCRSCYEHQLDDERALLGEPPRLDDGNTIEATGTTVPHDPPSDVP